MCALLTDCLWRALNSDEPDYNSFIHTDTHSPARHHRHFLPSSFQLIFIHAIRGAHKRGVRRSKLKRPRAREHRQSSIDLLCDGKKKKKKKAVRAERGKEEKNLWTSKIDWNFKRCLRSCDATIFPLNSFHCLWSPPSAPLLSSINRQILITWQSSAPMLIHSNERRGETRAG